MQEQIEAALNDGWCLIPAGDVGTGYELRELNGSWIRGAHWTEVEYRGKTVHVPDYFNG